MKSKKETSKQHAIFASEGSFVIPAAKGRGDIIAKFVFFLFFSVFPDFSRFPKSSETGIVFVAAAGGCLEK